MTRMRVAPALAAALLAALPIALQAAEAAAQSVRSDIIEQEALGLARPDTVVIHNSAEGPISFFLSAGEGPEEVHTMTSGDIGSFSDGNSQIYGFKIVTADRGEVMYELTGGNRYQIYWNSALGKWDLVQISPR